VLIRWLKGCVDMLKKCIECGVFFGAESDEDEKCKKCLLSLHKFKSSGDEAYDKYLLTREIVYENPDISPEGIIEIMKDMGKPITRKEIMGYVNEGKLAIASITEGKHCGECGVKIEKGRICKRCENKKEVEKINKQAEEHSDASSDNGSRKSGMHIKR